jgi:hypothetical protein
MDTGRMPTRRLRIFLRDFRMVEAQASFAEGQSLSVYFANRKSYLNLRGAQWAGTSVEIKHAALRLDQVLWVAAPDGDVDLTNASGQPSERIVEAQLGGGLLIRASLLMGERQRLSDYLESVGEFIPLVGAHLLRSGRPPRQANVTLGDIVLNQRAVQAVWEVSAQAEAREQPELEQFLLGMSDELPGL